MNVLKGLFCTFLLAGLCLPAVSRASGANDFNPYLHETLPNMRTPSSPDREVMKSLGAHETTLQKEAAHRVTWRNEVYPVLSGSPKAPGEILVLLDFANPQSEPLWNEVVTAFRSLSPEKTKLVLFAQSAEHYATDLLGLAIWIATTRPGQSMEYISYALHHWNTLKKDLLRHGIERPFNNEYDATFTDQELPMHYAYMARLRPPVPEPRQFEVAKYCYGAGSINTYQTTQIRFHYKVKNLPAVVVNGVPISASDVTAAAILNAAR